MYWEFDMFDQFVTTINHFDRSQFRGHSLDIALVMVMIVLYYCWDTVFLHDFASDSGKTLTGIGKPNNNDTEIYPQILVYILLQG